MNWDQVEGNWKQLKGSIRERWGKLTDDDMTVAEGRAEALCGRLQERYGMTKEQAEKEFNDFMKVKGYTV
jgi:uncharacterized protein YjbJ (UPF0337 family)